METVATVYLAGGVLCAAAFLIMALRGPFWEYARRNGFAAEVGHFGLRALLVLALWPLALVLFIVAGLLARRLGRRDRVDDLGGE